MAISKIGSKALVDCSVAAVDIEDNSITSAKLAGSIANAKLANSSITVNGTSINLGASGSIPAVSWQSVKTNADSPVTLVAGNGYFMNTTSGTITANLPASASAGDTIAIKDYAGTFATNNLTIGRNGHNIQGVANDSLISTNRASLTLVYVDATKGWLYAVESNVADLQLVQYVTATGGTITTSGDYKIHVFNGDGCFVVSCAGNSVGNNQVDYMVLAGGGGGAGGGYFAASNGGGGAGGFRESHSTCVSGPYTASPLATPTGLTMTATTYPVTVGGGGAGSCGPNNLGNNGSPSVFSTITSTGGGGGGSQVLTRVGQPGGSGGGGGGGEYANPLSSPGPRAGLGNTPPVSPPQGNDGGGTTNSGGGGPAGQSSGGGGGAGSAGQNTPGSRAGGNGGSGVTTSITTSPATYAGGGGGAGSDTGGSGGPGGGGNAGGGCQGGTNADANKGSGGGGGASNTPSIPYFNSAGNGGSGKVVIRYKFQN